MAKISKNLNFGNMMSIFSVVATVFFGLSKYLEWFFIPRNWIIMLWFASLFLLIASISWMIYMMIRKIIDKKREKNILRKEEEDEKARIRDENIYNAIRELDVKLSGTTAIVQYHHEIIKEIEKRIKHVYSMPSLDKV